MMLEGGRVSSMEEIVLPVSGADLKVYALGQGPGLLFLHGGPGDTHHYMRRMAEPLLTDFRCVFFDQRGTGESPAHSRQAESFHLDLLLEDLLAIKAHFNSEPLSLVGHSWGAMYALFACMKYPGQFKKAALLNMGPVDASMEEATAAHLLGVLNESEKTLWKNLRQDRNAARDRGDLVQVRALDAEMMKLRVKAWVFEPSLREIFLKDYFQDPSPDREVNKWIWSAQEGFFDWEKAPAIQNPLWICVGENDSVPLGQARRLHELVPKSELSIFEQCGHIPWLEHPARFYRELKQFLIS